MNIEDFGTAGGSGLFGALLSYLGINWRVNRLERDLESHKEKVVYKDTHKVCQESLKNQFDNLNNKMDYIIEKVDNLITDRGKYTGEDRRL